MNGFDLPQRDYFILKGEGIDCANRSSMIDVLPIRVGSAHDIGLIRERNVSVAVFQIAAEKLPAGSWTMCTMINELFVHLGEFVIGGPISVHVEDSQTVSNAVLLQHFDLVLLGAGLAPSDSLIVVSAESSCGQAIDGKSVLRDEEINLGNAQLTSTRQGIFYQALFKRVGNYRICWCAAQCVDHTDYTVDAGNVFSVTGPLAVFDMYHDFLHVTVGIAFEMIVSVLRPVSPDLALHLRIRPKHCCSLPANSVCQELVGREDFEYSIANVEGPDYIIFSNVIIPSAGAADLCYCPFIDASASTICNTIGQGMFVGGATSEEVHFDVYRPVESDDRSSIVSGQPFHSSSTGYGYAESIIVFPFSDLDHSGECPVYQNQIIGSLIEFEQQPYQLSRVTHEHSGISPGRYTLCGVLNPSVSNLATPLGQFEVSGPVSATSKPKLVKPFEPSFIIVNGHNLAAGDTIKLRTVGPSKSCGTGLVESVAEDWKVASLAAVSHSYSESTFSIVFSGAGRFSVCVCHADTEQCDQSDLQNYLADLIGDILVAGPGDISNAAGEVLVAVSNNPYTMRISWYGPVPQAESALASLRVRRHDHCAHPDASVLDVFGGPDVYGRASDSFDSFVFGDNFVQVALPPADHGSAVDACWCEDGQTLNSEQCMKIGSFAMLGAVNPEWMVAEESPVEATRKVVGSGNISQEALGNHDIVFKITAFGIQSDTKYFVAQGRSIDCAVVSDSQRTESLTDVTPELKAGSVYYNQHAAVAHINNDEFSLRLSPGPWTMCALVLNFVTKLGEFMIGGPFSLKIIGSELVPVGLVLEEFDLVLEGHGFAASDIVEIIPSTSTCGSVYDHLPAAITGLGLAEASSVGSELVYRAKFKKVGDFAICWCKSFFSNRICDGTNRIRVPGFFTVAGPLDVFDEHYSALHAFVGVPFHMIVTYHPPFAVDVVTRLRLRSAHCCEHYDPLLCQEYVTGEDFRYSIPSLSTTDHIAFSNVLVFNGGTADLCYCVAEACIGLSNRNHSFFIAGRISFSAARSLEMHTPVLAGLPFESNSSGYGFSDEIKVYPQPDLDAKELCDPSFNEMAFGQVLQVSSQSIPNFVTVSHSALPAGRYIMCAIMHDGAMKSPLGPFDVVGSSSVTMLPDGTA